VKHRVEARELRNVRVALHPQLDQLSRRRIVQRGKGRRGVQLLQHLERNPLMVSQMRPRMHHAVADGFDHGNHRTGKVVEDQRERVVERSGLHRPASSAKAAAAAGANLQLSVAADPGHLALQDELQRGEAVEEGELKRRGAAVQNKYRHAIPDCSES
jgi:hypothetical protein